MGLGLLLGVFVGPGLLRRWMFERLPQPVRTEVARVEGLTDTSAATCAACHTEIGAEWAATRMGQAWTDPVFQADFTRQGELYACRYCHTPLPEQRPTLVDGLVSLDPLVGRATPNPDHLPGREDEGVGCAVCHVSGGTIHGPREIGPAPHAVTVDPGFGDAALCAPCHQLAEPPLVRLDRPIADTHREWAEWQATTGETRTCVDCHMPPVRRPLVAGGEARDGRRHVFLGAWNDDFLREGLGIELTGRTLRLTNRAGHRYPTAEPLRSLWVRVEGRRGDTVVASREIPLARHLKPGTMKDEWDTTLAPGETRVIDLSLAGDPPSWRVEVGFDRLTDDPALAAVAPAPSRVVLWTGEGG